MTSNVPSLQGLDLSEIVIVPMAHFAPTPRQARLLDILISSALFVTFATTMITTLLIAYRIHSIAKENVPKLSRRRLNHVLEMLVQSSAAYSLAALAYAILIAVPFGSANPLTFNEAEAYLGPFYFFISVGGCTGVYVYFSHLEPGSGAYDHGGSRRFGIG